MVRLFGLSNEIMGIGEDEKIYGCMMVIFFGKFYLRIGI